MAYTVTIKYAAPVAPETNLPLHPIAADYKLGTSYVDDATFRADAGEAYSKNIYNMGIPADALETYLKGVTVHKGVLLVLKSVMVLDPTTASTTGITYDVETDDDKLYWEQLATALKDNGFTITVTAKVAA